MVNNFEVVFYTSAFIVPGFILYSTLESMVPRSKSSVINTTLKFLTATLIHYVTWSWLIYLMFYNEFFINHAVFFYMSAIFIIVISPCVFGLILARLSDEDRLNRILQILGYNPINPIPTAWDYKFSKMPTKSWVVISLNDGKIFYGKFSTKSFASSESLERDIYIEDVYILNPDNKWIRRESNDGILIRSEQIKYVEFFTN